MFTKNLILAASLSAILFSSSANAVIGPIKNSLYNPTENQHRIILMRMTTAAPFASETLHSR